MRIKVGLVLLVAVVLLPMRLLGCGQESTGQPPLTIETLSTKCRSEQTPSDIRAVGNTIIIIEAIETPNPCYEVKGEVTIEGTEIVVKLKPENTGDLCIQCIGEVVGRVTIPNLPMGIYSVKLETPQRAAITTIKVEE